jgi:hypothetical protein
MKPGTTLVGGEWRCYAHINGPASDGGLAYLKARADKAHKHDSIPEVDQKKIIDLYCNYDYDIRTLTVRFRKYGQRRIRDTLADAGVLRQQNALR